MDKAAKGILVVLDLNLVAEDGDAFDDCPNELVFLDGWNTTRLLTGSTKSAQTTEI